MLEKYSVPCINYLEKCADRYNGLNYAIIFWKDPFNTISKRSIGSDSFLEVTEWLSSMEEKYRDLRFPFISYLNNGISNIYNIEEFTK